MDEVSVEVANGAVMGLEVPEGSLASADMPSSPGR
jgi:hypothetical protein